MIRIVPLKSAFYIAPLLMVAGCGGAKDDVLNRLDADLTNNVSDPAIKAALEGPIIVDPSLTGQANINAVRTGEKPISGGVPLLKDKGTAADAQARNGSASVEAVANRDH